MSEVVKNQHYVPQFYLNNFTNENGNIFVYDKFQLKSFPSNPRGVASERYFYDFIDGETQIIEKKLNAKFERPFSSFLPSFLQKLNHQKHFRLKRYEKEEIASFLSYQYIRTKRFREESVRLFTSTDIYFSDPQFNPLLGHMFVLLDSRIQEKIYDNLCAKYYWIVGKNTTDQPFYTSDSAFVQRESIHEIHQKYSKEYADFSLLSDEISFPISPNFILTFYRKVKENKHLKNIMEE